MTRAKREWWAASRAAHPVQKRARLVLYNCFSYWSSVVDA